MSFENEKLGFLRIQVNLTQDEQCSKVEQGLAMSKCIKLHERRSYCLQFNQNYRC